MLWRVGLLLYDVDLHKKINFLFEGRSVKRIAHTRACVARNLGLDGNVDLNAH